MAELKQGRGQVAACTSFHKRLLRRGADDLGLEVAPAMEVFEGLVPQSLHEVGRVLHLLYLRLPTLIRSLCEGIRVKHQKITLNPKH